MTAIGISVTKGQILTIVQEVFSAMLDDGEMVVFESDEANSTELDLSAWVDMHLELPARPYSARALLHTREATAHAITRSLLMMEDTEEVTYDDLVDAFGELANVVGGNVKSLVATPAALSLPSVSRDVQEGRSGEFVQDLDFTWRGMPLNVSLWTLPR